MLLRVEHKRKNPITMGEDCGGDYTMGLNPQDGSVLIKLKDHRTVAALILEQGEAMELAAGILSGLALHNITPSPDTPLGQAIAKLGTKTTKKAPAKTIAAGFAVN
jgi:hypothetical protein